MTRDLPELQTAITGIEALTVQLRELREVRERYSLTLRPQPRATFKELHERRAAAKVVLGTPLPAP